MQTEIVLVTYARDRDLVRLLMDSLDVYAEFDLRLWIIDNEPNRGLEAFWQELGQGRRYPVMVRNRDQFDLEWLVYPRPRERLNRWQVNEPHRLRMEGWVNQQILKYAATELLDPATTRYLIVDSQNFLIKPWKPPETLLTPYRQGPWSMDQQVWAKYQQHYRLSKNAPEIMQSLCTPIWVDRGLLEKMFQDYGGLKSWSRWFVKHGDRFCSEFLCLWAYARSRGVWDQHYQLVPDWARAYLRDSDQFDQDFDKFLADLDLDITGQCWASVNHRSWQTMTDRQIALISKKLKRRSLKLDLEYLRTQWSLEELPEPPLLINTL